MMGIKDDGTRLQQKTGIEGNAHGFRKYSSHCTFWCVVGREEGRVFRLTN